MNNDRRRASAKSVPSSFVSICKGAFKICLYTIYLSRVRRNAKVVGNRAQAYFKHFVGKTNPSAVRRTVI